MQVASRLRIPVYGVHVVGIDSGRGSHVALVEEIALAPRRLFYGAGFALLLTEDGQVCMFMVCVWVCGCVGV